MEAKLLLKVCFVVGVVMLAVGNPIHPQSKADGMLERKIPDFQINDAPVSLVLQRLAGTSKTPIGIEALPEMDGNAKTITVRLSGTTVKTILDLVVEKDPHYLWQAVGSVINFFPKNAKDPLLETVVEHFEVKNVNQKEAIRALENSIEVKRLLLRSSLRDRTLESLPGDSEYNLPKFSLKIQNSNLRSILNAIMLESRSNSWVFFRFGSRNNSFSLLMR